MDRERRQTGCLCYTDMLFPMGLRTPFPCPAIFSIELTSLVWQLNGSKNFSGSPEEWKVIVSEISGIFLNPQLPQKCIFKTTSSHMWCHRNNAAVLGLLQFKTWGSDGVKKSSQLNEAWQMFSTASEKKFFNLSITARVPDMIKSQHTCPCERFQETKEGGLSTEASRNLRSMIIQKNLLLTSWWESQCGKPSAGDWGRGMSWVSIRTVTPHGKIWTSRGISTEPPIKNHSSIWKT